MYLVMDRLLFRSSSGATTLDDWIHSPLAAAGTGAQGMGREILRSHLLSLVQDATRSSPDPPPLGVSHRGKFDQERRSSHCSHGTLETDIRPR